MNKLCLRSVPIALHIAVVAAAGLASGAKVHAPAANNPSPQLVPEVSPPQVSPQVSTLPIVVRHAETGSMPKAVTVSPDGKHLVVTNFGFWGKRNLYWYDPATLQKIDQTDFGKKGNAVEAVFSPDSRLLYASNFNENAIEIIDVETHRVIKTLEVPLRPKIVVLSADGSKLMVANWDAFAATIYDTKDYKQLFKLKANEHPRGIAMTKSGKVYIAGFEGSELDVYDGPQLTEHKKVRACTHVRHMTLAPDDKTLYLSCYALGQLGVWDVATDKMTRLVQIGQEPKSSAVSTDGRYVFIANWGAPDQDKVSMVDTTTWKQRFVKVPKLDQACGLALSPDQHTLWVTGWTSKTLDAIDLSPLHLAMHPLQRDPGVDPLRALTRGHHRAPLKGFEDETVDTEKDRPAQKPTLASR
ncbi:MAG: beta-propeller fold lactonase family protein [Polyangiales bacterium]